MRFVALSSCYSAPGRVPRKPKTIVSDRLLIAKPYMELVGDLQQGGLWAWLRGLAYQSLQFFAFPLLAAGLT